MFSLVALYGFYKYPGWRLWEYCMPIMGTLYANYGNLVCRLWEPCIPIMGTLYADYGNLVWGLWEMVSRLWGYGKGIMDAQ